MCKLRSNNKQEKQCCWCKLVFAIDFVISMSLIVGGFCVPPTGVIDGSVLTAVGELILFPTLLYGYRAVELGLQVRFQRGDTSIEINKGMDNGVQEGL